MECDKQNQFHFCDISSRFFSECKTLLGQVVKFTLILMSISGNKKSASFIKLKFNPLLNIFPVCSTWICFNEHKKHEKCRRSTDTQKNADRKKRITFNNRWRVFAATQLFGLLSDF